MEERNETGDENLHNSMERVGTLALEWRAKAERYETALMLIESGAFLGASTYAAAGDFKGFAAAVQLIARSALLLSNTGGTENG